MVVNENNYDLTLLIPFDCINVFYDFNIIFLKKMSRISTEIFCIKFFTETVN